MGKAMVDGDIEKLKEIYADDFVSVGSDGKRTTKQNLVSDLNPSMTNSTGMKMGLSMCRCSAVSLWRRASSRKRGAGMEKIRVVSFFGRIS